MNCDILEDDLFLSQKILGNNRDCIDIMTTILTRNKSCESLKPFQFKFSGIRLVHESLFNRCNPAVMSLDSNSIAWMNICHVDFLDYDFAISRRFADSILCVPNFLDSVAVHVVKNEDDRPPALQSIVFSTSHKIELFEIRKCLEGCLLSLESLINLPNNVQASVISIEPSTTAILDLKKSPQISIVTSPDLRFSKTTSSSKKHKIRTSSEARCLMAVLESDSMVNDTSIYASYSLFEQLELVDGCYIFIRNGKNSKVVQVRIADIETETDDHIVAISPRLAHILSLDMSKMYNGSCNETIYCQISKYSFQKLQLAICKTVTLKRIDSIEFVDFLKYCHKFLNMPFEQLYDIVFEQAKKFILLKKGKSFSVYSKDVLFIPIEIPGIRRKIIVSYAVNLALDEQNITLPSLINVDSTDLKFTSIANQAIPIFCKEKELSVRHLYSSILDKCLKYLEKSNRLLLHYADDRFGSSEILVQQIGLLRNAAVSHFDFQAHDSMETVMRELSTAFVNDSLLRIIHLDNVDHILDKNMGSIDAKEAKIIQWKSLKLFHTSIDHISTLNTSAVIVVSCKSGSACDSILPLFPQNVVVHLSEEEICSWIQSNLPKSACNIDFLLNRIATLSLKTLHSLSAIFCIRSRHRHGNNSSSFSSSIDLERDFPRLKKSQQKYSLASKSKVKFKDVGGLVEAKKELVSSIILPIKRPDLFQTQPRTGLLFYGPPGCGKTMLAKAIAGEIEQCHFMSVKGPELMDKYIGETEKSLRELFMVAKSHKRCIIFFDELDALLGSKSSSDSGSAKVMSRIVSQFASEMDMISQDRVMMNQSNEENSETKPFVLVIAATNRADLLDPLLLRPGRFDKSVYVGPPETFDQVEEFFITLSNNLPCDPVELTNKRKELCELIPIGRWTGADFYGASTSAFQRALERSVEDNEFTDNIIVSSKDWEDAIVSWKPSLSKQELLSYGCAR